MLRSTVRYNQLTINTLCILPAALGQQAKHLKSYLSDTYAARQTRGGNAWGATLGATHKGNYWSCTLQPTLLNRSSILTTAYL